MLGNLLDRSLTKHMCHRLMLSIVNHLEVVLSLQEPSERITPEQVLVHSWMQGKPAASQSEVVQALDTLGFDLCVRSWLLNLRN